MPTIRDRVAQAVVKNALEPEWEARFEANSYGFRPGRGCHDAIEQVWVRLNAQAHDAWVLDADIQGAFDNISHAALMHALGATPGRGWIRAWLKAGYMEAGRFHATESGTPQGGIISPLLANVALDGMGRWVEGFTTTRVYQVHSGPSAGRMMRKTVQAYGFIRYADDFVVTAPTKESLEALRPQLANWLAGRGLKFNEEKTRICHKVDGFNFLGFTVRSYGGKCLITPQKEKVQAKLREIKAWLYAHPNIVPDVAIAYLNPILRGWANYYRHAVSKRAFATFDHRMVQMLIRWAKRRHPNKGGRWVVPRYFGTLGRDRWVFKAKTLTRRGDLVDVYLYRLANTRIIRHIKVHGSASPDDPSLADYWTQRRTRHGQAYYRPGTKLYRIAQTQRWKCPCCHQHLFSGEQLHIHHVAAVARGGDDEEENLHLVHASCHRLIHEHSDQVCVARGLEPYDG
jgi:RNA-directed DNA polymerase